MGNSEKARGNLNGIGLVKVLIVFALLLSFGYAISSCSATRDPSQNENVSGYDPLPGNANSNDSDAPNSISNLPPDSPELAKFNHINEHHGQLSCLICHRRSSESPTVGFPGKENHSPCIGCHSEQFRYKESLICTICHTDPESGDLKDFPPLTGFNAKFDHARHLRLTSCATCHKQFGRGVALTIPSGANAHATCFACHTASAANTLSSCDVCHEQGKRPGAPRINRTAYSRSFSHNRHKAMTCSACHMVLRSGGRGNQVTSPDTKMHLVSGKGNNCATCHNDNKAFGGEDFSSCSRCHQGSSFGFARPRL